MAYVYIDVLCFLTNFNRSDRVVLSGHYPTTVILDPGSNEAQSFEMSIFFLTLQTVGIRFRVYSEIA